MGFRAAYGAFICVRWVQRRSTQGWGSQIVSGQSKGKGLESPRDSQSLCTLQLGQKGFRAPRFQLGLGFWKGSGLKPSATSVKPWFTRPVQSGCTEPPLVFRGHYLKANRKLPISKPCIVSSQGQKPVMRSELLQADSDASGCLLAWPRPPCCFRNSCEKTRSSGKDSNLQYGFQPTIVESGSFPTFPGFAEETAVCPFNLPETPNPQDPQA